MFFVPGLAAATYGQIPLFSWASDSRESPSFKTQSIAPSAAGLRSKPGRDEMGLRVGETRAISANNHATICILQGW